jgi:hypothetical protein
MERSVDLRYWCVCYPSFAAPEDETAINFFRTRFHARRV